MNRTLLATLVAAALMLLVLLLWPRPVETPGVPNAALPEADLMDQGQREDDDAQESDGIDTEDDWRSLLRDDRPAPPPPSGTGLLQDLQDAVDQIPTADEVERDPVRVDAQLPPIPPPNLPDPEEDDDETPPDP
jgi:hypothetical protein